MSTNLKSILFVVNSPNFFLSHRLPLAIAAKKAGYEVHIATASGHGVSKIKSKGLIHHSIPFERSGQNIFFDFLTFISLIKLFRSVRPTLIHLVTIKPVIYGGIAARLVGIKSVIAAISGLGTVFIDKSFSGYLRQLFVFTFYRAAFKHCNFAVIFQNLDDKNVFIEKNLVKSDYCHIIRGSGVNLSEYSFIPEPDSIPIIVMASRLLKDKGVFEFVESAKILKKQGLKIIFRLIGESDSENKTSISQKLLKKWQSEDFVELLGYREDIADQYAKANIVCLPSYREGLPKSLIEAAACGRAVVTTDVPGCRDAITPGITGLLCSVKDADNLAITIKTLIDDPNMRREMGRAGRELAQAEFAIEYIVNKHLDLYSRLTK